MLLILECLEGVHQLPLPNGSTKIEGISKETLDSLKWFGSLNIKRTGNNVWQDTNNPWNIMAENPKQMAYAKSLWAIGSYKSPNWRTYAVFPDMSVGMKATESDIGSKLSWWSSWVTPSTTLAQFASWWTVWPNAPLNQWAVNNYSKLTGYPPNTRIQDIPRDILINAIVRNEWVNPSISAKIV